MLAMPQGKQLFPSLQLLSQVLTAVITYAHVCYSIYVTPATDPRMTDLLPLTLMLSIIICKVHSSQITLIW